MIIDDNETQIMYDENIDNNINDNKSNSIYQIVLKRVGPDIIFYNFTEFICSSIGVIGKPRKDRILLLFM